MNTNEHVLQSGAEFSDWDSASPEARAFYCQTACQKCEKLKLGKVKTSDAIGAINDFYADPVNRRYKLSGAFGICFSTLVQLEARNAENPSNPL